MCPDITGNVITAVNSARELGWNAVVCAVTQSCHSSDVQTFRRLQREAVTDVGAGPLESVSQAGGEVRRTERE